MTSKSAASADFNSGFSFDVGGSAAGVRQAPWELASALKQAYPDGHNLTTSIDQKILERISNGKSSNSKVPAHLLRKRQARAPVINDPGSDIDSDSEDDPLPGELESDDDDNDDGNANLDSEAEEADSDSGAGISGSGSDDDDNAAVQAKGGVASQRTAAVSAAAASGARHQHSTPSALKEQAAERPTKKQKLDSASAGAAANGHSRQHTAADGAPQTAAANSTHAASGAFYAQTPEGTTFSATSFSDLNISRPLLKACAALGYTVPTPIQAACIPLALSGRDICGSAMTGSGKTAAFSLPLLERLLHRPRQVAATYVLVLTPTRELAVQVHSMIQQLAQFTDVQAALIVGGLSLQVQAAVLRRSPEIVVATPGRMIDHLRNTQSFGLEDLSVLVLDEADRLLEMGFAEEIRELVRLAPKKRQTMLFSATFGEQVKKLVGMSLRSPVRLAADVAMAAPRELTQEVVRLKEAQSMQKEAVLLALCARSFSDGRTIVFCRTKQRAHRLKILFGLANLPTAAELHGNMSQTARLESLEAFRKGEVAFLLATDVAARGLDIQGVQAIINFDAPMKLETYLHRIGRTARAGASGRSVTLVEDGDRALLKEVVKRTAANMLARVVPQQAVAAWQETIERLELDVSAILSEERDEADLRKAEMEANKASNLLEHEEEIFSRPARSWFQTERQKRELAKRAKAIAQGMDTDVDPNDDYNQDVEDGARSSAAAAKNKSAKKSRMKEEAAEQGKKRKVSALDEETASYSRNVRSIKSRARALVEQGMPSTQASKIAAAAVTGFKPKKQSKKKGKSEGGTSAASKEGGDKLFSGDGIGKAGSSAGSKSAAPAVRQIRTNMSKTEVARVKRGGRGKAAFKSKKKFKRK